MDNNVLALSMVNRKPIDILAKANKTLEDLNVEASVKAGEDVTKYLDTLKDDIVEAKAMIATTENKVKFLAKYASDDLVSKNFKLLQDIIEDEPTYEVIETPTGAKTIRTDGTEQKDRIAAMNAFFKYNLAPPSDTGKGTNHLHVHGDTNSIMNKFLTKKPDKKV